MKVIWKYPVPVGPAAAHGVPANAEIVHVGEQFSMPTLWVEAKCDKEGRAEIEEERMFRAFATGAIVPDDAKYIGTAVCNNGTLVWHIYEVRFETQS